MNQFQREMRDPLLRKMHFLGAVLKAAKSMGAKVNSVNVTDDDLAEAQRRADAIAKVTK